MGWWKTKRGIGGDSWADEMGRCMKKLQTIKYHDTQEITMQEFADLVEFCSRGHIIAELRHEEDAQRPLSKLHTKKAETYCNRGQIHGLEV